MNVIRRGAGLALALTTITLTPGTPAFASDRADKMDAVVRQRARQLTGRTRVIVEFTGEPDVRAPEPFGAYLALGITVLLATQTVVNLGAVTGLLPTKGLPLPFISFGGSALIMTMVSTGVLLNISQHSHV
jgi:hypothetical protein